MMVKKIDSEGTTTYIGSIYEIHVDNEEVETTTTYYPAAGAMRVKVGETETEDYIVADHLGNVLAIHIASTPDGGWMPPQAASVTLNEAGGLVGGKRYYPFGETREP